MSSGPAASPSSQMVTRSTLTSLFSWPWLRSNAILFATGTREMQVKVLRATQVSSHKLGLPNVGQALRLTR